MNMSALIQSPPSAPFPKSFPRKPIHRGPLAHQSNSHTSDSDHDSADFKTLIRLKSSHNDIRVLEVSRRADHSLAGARILLLDSPGNIHSICFPSGRPLTSSYLDVFATLPPLLPPGPLALLGFGAGSAARLLLHLFPSVPLWGYELDPDVLAVSRDFLGLGELERQHGGDLVLRVGNGLEAEVEGGFAGMAVDLFARGSVAKELQETGTWEKLKGRVREGGRIVVNCGGKSVESEEEGRDGGEVARWTLRAMAAAFGEGIMVLDVGEVLAGEDTCLAMTGGPVEDVEGWKQKLPLELRGFVDFWRPLVE